MIESLISRLQAAGLALTYEELADALWLAEQLDAPVAKRKPSKPEANQDDVQVRIEEAGPLENAVSPVSAMPLFAADAIATEDTTEEDAAPEGLPFQAPAATALPNAIALSRAMRSLSRKVPSQTQVELDEAATVEHIAAQRIFVPVVRPALERWLDLELVVEDSAMSFVWRQTIEAFRKQVLERLGAFRNARTWRLQADDQGQLKLWPYLPGRGTPGTAGSESVFARVKPRSPKVLMHPSGRRLILLVSDCRSPLWQARPQRSAPGQTFGQSGARQSAKLTIYDWLQRWAQQGPTTVVQLLPERLWPQTQLGYGDAVQLSALLPGVANVNLTVAGATDWQALDSAADMDVLGMGAEGIDEPEEMGAYQPEPLPLPVVTLDAAPMRQWAKVIAGRGNERTPGFWFDVGLLHRFPSEETGSTGNLSATARVNRFFASAASPPAKQLVRLMAAAPVSLSVVHLLQAKLLPQAMPVHIAEVYMSGLLQATGKVNRYEEPVYDFAEGVRQRIVQVSNPALAMQVFAQLTEKIKAEMGPAGEAIDSFDALLSPEPEWVTSNGLVAPFAAVAMAVLKAMGGAYAALAETVEAGEQIARQSVVRVATVEYLPLAVLEFSVGELVEDGVPEDDAASDTVEEPLLKTANFMVATIRLPANVLEIFEFETATVERKRAGLFRRLQWTVSKRRAQGQRFVEPLTDDVSLEMVAIPGGTFLMGSPDDEPERTSAESPQHEVEVPDFCMGRYAVTQAQWRFVAALPSVSRDLEGAPSSFNGDSLPVESVSWDDATEFCSRLSAYTNRTYRLPSEAEWEYACRAGTRTPFSFGDTISTEVANYDGSAYAGGPSGKARNKTTPVDEFGIANSFGLCGMHGNVDEWCQDHWHRDYEGAPTDGSAWLTEDEEAGRVIRGGAWYYLPRNCRSAPRLYITPGNRYLNVGFRVCC